MNGGFYVLSFQDFVFTAKVDTDKIDYFIDIMNDLNRCFGFALMFHNDNQVIWRDMRSLTKNDYDPKKKKYSQGKWYKIAHEFIAIYEEQGYADRGERAEEFLQLIYMKILSIYDHDIHNFFKGLQEFNYLSKDKFEPSGKKKFYVMWYEKDRGYAHKSRFEYFKD